MAEPGPPPGAGGGGAATAGVDLEAVPGPAPVAGERPPRASTARAAQLLLGRRAAELAGRPCVEALAARDATGSAPWPGGWPASARLAGVRGWPDVEVTVRRGDGTDVALLAAGRYLRGPAGAVAGAVVALRPAARRSAAPSAIEVVSTVSHELRSPLTSVKGYTSLLLHRWDRLADEQKRMMLGQIEHDADRVVRLITELLDISRLETGRLVLRRQLVDLDALARSVVAKVALEWPALDAEVDTRPGMPRVWADPDKLEQVLTNLVENACKYASPEGLRITVGDTGDGTAVVVADRGDGIPSEDLPRVFTKFFRRSEGRPTGSGLGLWISRGLVEAHGGALTATSEPGRGSAFRFTLPHVDLEELQRT